MTKLPDRFDVIVGYMGLQLGTRQSWILVRGMFVSWTTRRAGCYGHLLGFFCAGTYQFSILCVLRFCFPKHRLVANWTRRCERLPPDGVPWRTRSMYTSSCMQRIAFLSGTLLFFRLSELLGDHTRHCTKLVISSGNCWCPGEWLVYSALVSIYLSPSSLVFIIVIFLFLAFFSHSLFFPILFYLRFFESLWP